MPEQFGIGVAETVDTLLLVADDEIFMAVGEAFHHQRTQIVPLHARRVLHLVDEEMAQIVAQALVDERSLVVVYDVAEQRVGIGEEYYVVVLAEIGDMPKQAAEQSERRYGVDKHLVALAQRCEGHSVGTQRSHSEVKLLRDTLPAV